MGMDMIKTFFLTLASAAYWRDILWALVRTFIAGVIPFVPALSNPETAQTALPLAATTLALLLIVTALTSVKGIPDPDGAPWFTVLFSRFLRQFAQFSLTALAGFSLFSEVNWFVVLTGALASAISTALIYALTIIPGGGVVDTPEDETDLPTDTDLEDVETPDTGIEEK